MGNYLAKNTDGTYSEKKGFSIPSKDWIEIPEGAECAILGSDNNLYFWKSNFFTGGIHENWVDMKKGCDANWYLNTADGAKLVWHRATQPEELPFIDDEPTKQDLIDLSNKSLDTVLNTDLSQPMELEQVRQHRHYFIDVSDVDEIDFYEIALRYNVTDPCIQHILKKCLAVGQRGQKDFHHDLKDIYDTAKRMLDVHGLDS